MVTFYFGEALVLLRRDLRLLRRSLSGKTHPKVRTQHSQLYLQSGGGKTVTDQMPICRLTRVYASQNKIHKTNTVYFSKTKSPSRSRLLYLSSKTQSWFWHLMWSRL